MIFIVRDYLETLRERDELDLAIINLLLAMGFRILRKPIRGQPEYGLDIAAYGSIGKDDPALYLIQIKQGNITRGEWDSSNPNSVRPSLNAILDHLEGFRKLATPIEVHQVKLVLANNGYIDNNVKDSYDGYVSHVHRAYQIPVENWNINWLTHHFMEHMLREELFPSPAAQEIRRLLAFIETPGYDFRHLRHLLLERLPQNETLTPGEIDRRMSQIVCLAAIIEHYAETEGAQQGRKKSSSSVGNLLHAVRAYELVFLHVFCWLRQHDKLNGSTHILRLLDQYVTCSLKLLRKVEPLLKIEDGWAVRGSVSEVIEYPLRAFSFGGLAAQTLLILARLSPSPTIQKEMEFLGQFLYRTRKMISGIQRPLFDHHMIEIALLFVAFIVMNDRDGAILYLDGIVGRLRFDAMRGKPLPEASGNLEAMGYTWLAEQRHPDYLDASSTLLTLLAELATILEQPRIYELIRETWRTKVNFQQSYPTADLVSLNGPDKEEKLERFKVEHSIPIPESALLFRSEIEARRIHDEPIKAAWTSIPLFDLACFVTCRLERHRLPPFFWRQLLDLLANKPATSPPSRSMGHERA